MLTRFNALMFRALVAVLPDTAFEYSRYGNPDNIGYEGALLLKSSGRCVAFIKQGGGLVYGWCDSNWFSQDYAR